MLKENELNVLVTLTDDFTIFDCNDWMEDICENFGATVVASGFFMRTNERDITFQFDDWYDRNMAGTAIEEERLVGKKFSLIYGED